MRTLTSALRATDDIRQRARRASVTVMTIGIIILLTATSMAIFATVSSTMTASRVSRDLLRSRENLDTAVGDATATLGSTLASRSGTGDGDLPGRPSNWSWSRTWTTPGNADVGGHVTAQGRFNKAIQIRTRAWRSRTVASQLNMGGEPTYGVTARSAWLATVSSEDDSTLTGSVNGDWHAYGVGRITVPAGSNVHRVIAYDDNATFTGNVTTFRRSTLAATLDERLLNQRVRSCGTTGLTAYVSSEHGGVLDASQAHCYYSLLIDQNTRVQGASVATIVSYGDIDIEADLEPAAGTELHLYTAAGTIKFNGGANVDAYVFAPNALCMTYDAATVDFTGSLACRQIQMRAQFHQAPAPRPEPAWPYLPAEPTTQVTFLEGPGYVDRFTPSESTP